MTSPKPVKRLAFAVALIAFYFLLINLILSVYLYQTFFVLTSFLLLPFAELLPLATFLGLATDYFFHPYSWKPMEILILKAVWIAIYFLLIDITVSILISGTFLERWIPSTLLLFGAVATVLWLATDHFCPTFFNWYSTKSLGVFLIMMVALTGMGSLMYNHVLEMVPPPHFERLAIRDVYHNSLTNVTVLVDNIGNVDANITNVFVNGEPLSATNGRILSPEIPFVLEMGTVQTVRLSFSSPLSSNVSCEVTVHTYIGSNYTGTVTIP